MSTRPVTAARIFAVVLILAGLVVAAGGAWLAILGGSVYYVLGGAAVVIAAALLWRSDARGAGVYAAFLLATLVWSLSEVRLDAWALAPRLLGPAILGLSFALAQTPARLKHGRRFALIVAGCAIATFVMPGIAALLPGAQPATLQIADAPPLASEDAPGEWPNYGNTQAGTRFSPLTQIGPGNVAALHPVWTYRTGIHQSGQASPLEVTPLMVGNTLYLCTQTDIVIALDPETGHERWRFDPEVDATGGSNIRTCRGVAFYRNTDAADCPERIISATFDDRLLALNASTGQLCQSFGKGGIVDLKAGMGEIKPGFSYVSSAPEILRGNIILGGWIADNYSTDEPSGVVRAFDAGTGRFAWAWDLGRPGFHLEPQPGQTYTRSTPNSWAPMSGDEKLGLVYVPTGNATPDHWGGKRSALTDQFSSAIVALDASTGEPRWSFQTTHHDVWDYDVGSQPTLIDLPLAGGIVPALIQPTKRGQIFLLDRRDGKPIAPVEERPVPHDAAPGDRLAPTQPFSTGMPDIAAGPSLTEADMWGITPIDQLWCRIRFRSMRYDGPLTPVGMRAALDYPGIGGGVNWGGISVDPERGVMVMNSIHVATEITLTPRAGMDSRAKGVPALHGEISPQFGTPYAVIRRTFMSPLGIPCNRPPYGLISVIDLKTRQLVWSHPLGTARDTGPLGIESHLPLTIGVPNLGGTLTTRSGLIFVGATQERAFRALDLKTGRELWNARLPAGGQTTPMTYVSPESGRQFVILVAGGNILVRSRLGDYVIAYALPAAASGSR